MLTLRRSLSVLALALAAACASGGANPGGSAINRAVIADAEFASATGESTLEFIQRMRPEWLRARPAQGGAGTLAGGSAEAPPPSVIVNGQHIGELADLRAIPAVTVKSARFYGIDEAKRRFGMQYNGGIIELTYR